MPRIILLDVTDEEHANLIKRFAVNGTTIDTDDDAGPAVQIADGETDSAGVPWLELVHASTKGKTNDGKWRGKKGVTPEQRAAAEAQYLNTAPALTVAGPEPVAPPALPVAAPVMPGLPGFPPVVAPAPVPPISYEDLVAKFQAGVAAGTVTPEAVGEIYKKLGVTDVNVLMTDETLRRAVYDAIG